MSGDQTDGLLIAETSENGDITWLWVLKNGDRMPRPFRQRDAGLPHERFNITGAPRNAIASWLGSALPS